MGWQLIGKWLVSAGIVLLLLGLAVQFSLRIPHLGRLPGDVLIKRDRFLFYFPITTCILISLILMLISRFFGPK